MAKRKFIVMGDTKNAFLNIEFDLVLDDDDLGTEVNVLGGTFKITQNGKILVLANPDWVLTLQDVTPEPEVEAPKLIINQTFDIFFETKEIDVRTQCTYSELYKSLENEWEGVKSLTSIAFPFKYSSDLKLFSMMDGWNFSKEHGVKNLKDGSFSRYSEDGRCI